MHIVIVDGMEMVVWLLAAGLMLVGAGIGAVVASRVGLEEVE